MKEIQSFKDFFASRSAPGGDGVSSSLMGNFKTALICQINNLEKMAPEEGATVNEALKDSPYTADHKQEVEQAIDAKVGMSVKQTKAPKPGAAKQQLLKHIWNYPTQAEWDVLLDAKKIPAQKLGVLSTDCV